MCGLAGFLEAPGRPAPDLLRLVQSMADTLVHRGPDDSGTWCDERVAVALGFRRLSIIDVSERGHQPMTSGCGRMSAIFNGEIYNYRELRDELAARGCVFRGHSDTEVVVEGFARWGVRATVERLNGMFAIAAWDAAERTLHLARDRLGIKPLYFGSFGRLFVFGSELKALRAHPGWTPVIDRRALTAFLRFAYVPTPGSIYQGVRKLPPGSLLELPAGAAEPRIVSYWSAANIARDASRGNPQLDDAGAVETLERLLDDAVGRQMLADVPVGAFLSGGVDSSTVVAFMQRHSARPVRTFSIGFAESGYDEAPHARQVAAHLGTDHTELYVRSEDALAVIPQLPRIYDEPFADSSQIPTYLISKLTRRHVTVCLSGDGGDELFAGYNRYIFAEAARRRAAWLPRPLRGALGALIGGIRPSVWEAGNSLLPARMQVPAISEKLDKLAGLLKGELTELHRSLASHWHDPAAVVVDGCEAFDDPAWFGDDTAGLVERMQLTDILTYLPDDILAKVDRASMAASLEARVPLLDHRLVEMALHLPAPLRLRSGESKWLLRQVLYRHVPRHLIERPKMGFGIPLHAWLRGPLRDWAESLIDEGRLAREGWLQPAPIRSAWREHLDGRRNRQYRLWPVLMFQAWLADQHANASKGAVCHPGLQPASPKRQRDAL
jgi:asparagine synthase (glutamine-hydrolysing)